MRKPEWIHIPAGEWLPDQPALNNPGDKTAINVISVAGGYAPLSGTAAYLVDAAAGYLGQFTANLVLWGVTTGAAALDQYLFGAKSLVCQRGNIHVFAGRGGRLLELDRSASWNSAITGMTVLTSGDSWNIIPFGNNLIAHKYPNAAQFSSDLSLPGATVFSAMSPAGPIAKFGCRINDFVLFANLRESGVDYQNRVRWSAYNRPQDYVQSNATQSDFQDLRSGSEINGVIGFQKYALIFQRDAITKMSYVGPPLIFRFDEIVNNIGCFVPGSLVEYKQTCYFWGLDGIYSLSADGQLNNIGAQRVARDVIYSKYNQGGRFNVSSAACLRRRIIVWAYPTGSSPLEASRLLIYSLDTGKFSESDIGGHFVYRIFNCHVPEGAGSQDSAVYKQEIAAFLKDGGDTSLAARMIVFSGEPMRARIGTKEIRSKDGRRMEIMNARPVVENNQGGGTAVAAVQIGTRNVPNVGAAVSYSTTSTANAQGECNVRTSGKLARVRLQLSGDWEKYSGVDVLVREAGDR